MNDADHPEKILIDEAISRIEDAGIAIIPCSIPTGGGDFEEGYALVEYQQEMELLDSGKIIKLDTNLHHLILRFANNE